MFTDALFGSCFEWLMNVSVGLSSVEVYSPKADEWMFVAPMNTRRSSVGVGVVDGELSEFMCVDQSAHYIEIQVQTCQ